MFLNNVPQVAIIILNYNGSDDTVACLESLQRISYPNYHIVVVDNASTDDSVSVLLNYLKSTGKAFTQVDCADKVPLQKEGESSFFTLIQSEVNGGYGHGNNIGILHGLNAGADYILVLNNDTEVEPNFLEPLVNSAEANSNIGIVSGKMYFYDQPDTIWFNGGQLGACNSKVTHFNFNEKDIGQPTQKEISFITGCMWLIPKKVFERVGYINETYFMYVEDVEFCKRVTLSGFKLVVIPESKIYHKVGGSTGGMLSEFSVYWRVRNMHRFVHDYVEKRGCRYLSYFRFNVIYLLNILKSLKFSLLFVYVKSLLSLRKG